MKVDFFISHESRLFHSFLLNLSNEQYQKLSVCQGIVKKIYLVCLVYLISIVHCERPSICEIYES